MAIFRRPVLSSEPQLIVVFILVFFSSFSHFIMCFLNYFLLLTCSINNFRWGFVFHLFEWLTFFPCIFQPALNSPSKFSTAASKLSKGIDVSRFS